MATIFSANEGAPVRKIVSRPTAGTTLILLEDGTVKCGGRPRFVVSQETMCAPPLPPGVSYVDIECADKGSNSEGFCSARLSDGTNVHWGVDECWSGATVRANYKGQPSIPMASYLTSRSVSHTNGLRVVAYPGGFHLVRDGEENFTWYGTDSDVASLKCDRHGNRVILLADGSIHHEGSNLMKFVDPDWRYSRIVEVEGGPHNAVCIAGITKSGMAVQLTCEVKGFPSKELGDEALILPVPVGVVESVISVKDSEPLSGPSGRRSRITYETTVRLPPDAADTEGRVVKVCHLAPRAHCAASRLPHIVGESPRDREMRVNYSAFVSGSKREDWVQMMVEAVANDPNIIQWLPGSLRKHPRLRGLQGLMKL